MYITTKYYVYIWYVHNNINIMYIWYVHNNIYNVLLICMRQIDERKVPSLADWNAKRLANSPGPRPLLSGTVMCLTSIWIFCAALLRIEPSGDTRHDVVHCLKQHITLMQGHKASSHNPSTPRWEVHSQMLVPDTRLPFLVKIRVLSFLLVFSFTQSMKVSICGSHVTCLKPSKNLSLPFILQSCLSLNDSAAHCGHLSRKLRAEECSICTTIPRTKC